MKPKTWTYSGDVNFLDYGGKLIRPVGDSTLRFHVIELTNMEEACGRDNEGQPKYVVELSEIDLETLDPASFKSALSFVGYEPSETPINPLWLAEACHSYGCRAPLHSVSTNNGLAGIRECKRESRALEVDASAYEERMNRPVNALGSTAREYARGDIASAMARGVSEGDPRAILLAKMEDACRVACCGAVQRLGGIDHAPTCKAAKE